MIHLLTRMARVLLPLSLFLPAVLKAQNIGIGTTAPHASALLEMNSASKGLLLPKISLLSPADVTTVPAPAVGLLIINLNSNTAQMPDGGGFYVWTGTAWIKLLMNENGSATAGWTTSGNTGTSSSINFLGTVDNQPLVFKINNGFAGKIDVGGTLGLGRGALQNAQPDRINTAFGDSALYNNGITSEVFPFASNNTAIGNKAMYANIRGDRNVAVGHLALWGNTHGRANTAMGFQSLQNNDLGLENTAYGANTLRLNTSSSGNTAIGTSALANNLDGFSNSALGRQTLSVNTSGFFNAALGAGALLLNKSGSNNTAAGSEALNSDTSGFSNTVVGFRALYSEQSGSNLVAVGDSALHKQNNGSTHNTAIGSKALFNLTTGIQNTAAGYQAAFSTNNSFGTYAGYQAGRNTSGVSNTYIGWGAGGDAAVATVTTGGDNVCIGVRAGQSITTGSQNIAIGNLANIGAGGLSNTVTIGHSFSNTQSNSVVIGNGAVTKWGFGINTGAANILEFNNSVTTARLTTGGVWTNASDRFLKHNFSQLDKADVLHRIMQLPVTRWSYIKESGSITHIGPVAQDFYALFGAGGDDKTISTIDPAGVALVGVQQLQLELEQVKKELVRLKRKLRNIK